MKRKMISLCLILALVVCMALPAFALSSMTTHKYDEGDFPYVNSTYHFECDTAASTSYASASMTFGFIDYQIGSSIVAYIAYGTRQFANPANALNHSHVTCGVNNRIMVDGSYVTGRIDHAVGTYTINGVVVNTRTVS